MKYQAKYRNSILREFAGAEDNGQKWQTNDPDAARRRRIRRLKRTNQNRRAADALKDVSFLGGKP